MKTTWSFESERGQKICKIMALKALEKKQNTAMVRKSEKQNMGCLPGSEAW